MNDVFDRIDEAIGGVQAITISGTTTTLTSANYSTDQARKAALVFSGTLTANSNVIVPNVEKLYLVINNTTGSYSLTVKTSGGTGYALRSGPNWVYCDGTNVNGAEPRLDQIPLPTAGLDLNTQRITNLGTPSVSTDAATKAYVDAAVSTTPTQNLATSAGTALAPTYSWATDSNTGMYLVGSDSLGLSAGGTVRATVSTTGLAVNGVFSASGAMTASGGLGVTGALATTGSASIGTTLGVTGAATFGSTLGVTGAVTASSTLAVSGAVTASNGITVSGAPVLTAAGSASAPSHSFSGDTNTGMYGPGSDVLRFATAGADRMSIDATGNVGIGRGPYVTTNYTTLSVQGTLGGVIEMMDTAGDLFGRIYSQPTDTVVVQCSRTGGKIVNRIGSTDRTTITSAGALVVSSTATTNPGVEINPDGYVYVGNAAQPGGTGLVNCYRSGVYIGGITQSGTTGVNYNTTSDYRLKDDVEPLVGALSRLGKLKPSRFRYKADPKNARKIDGFIAHEVEHACPEAVTGDKDGTEMQGLDKSRLIPLLVGAVQELLGRVETLEKAAKVK